MAIKPNIVIIGRVEKETVGVKSNHKDVLAYARGLIDKHFVAKEESFYTVRPYGDYYYYEIHEGGNGKAYLPSIMKALELMEKSALKKDNNLSQGGNGGLVDEDEQEKEISFGLAEKIKKIFTKKTKNRSDDVDFFDDSAEKENKSSCEDTFYIKGAIKCSKIKFNGNNMIFSFTSESENKNIKTTDGLSQSVAMTPFFSDFSNVKVVMFVFVFVSLLFFLSTIVFREIGFRERIFYIKGDQVINVPMLIEKAVRGAGVSDDEYVEKVIFNNGQWVLKKRKIVQNKRPEMLDEMMVNKELLEDGVSAVKDKKTR